MSETPEADAARGDEPGVKLPKTWIIQVGMAATRNPGLERQGLARDSASRAGHLEHFPITNNRKMLRESLLCRVFEPEKWAPLFLKTL